MSSSNSRPTQIQELRQRARTSVLGGKREALGHYRCYDWRKRGRDGWLNVLVWNFVLVWVDDSGDQKRLGQRWQIHSSKFLINPKLGRLRREIREESYQYRRSQKSSRTKRLCLPPGIQPPGIPPPDTHRRITVARNPSLWVSLGGNRINILCSSKKATYVFGKDSTKSM